MVLAGNPFARNASPQVRLLSPKLLSDGTFQFMISGAEWLDCQLQTSTNLTEWSDWLSLVCTNDLMPAPADPGSTNLPRRFFRVRQP